MCHNRTLEEKEQIPRSPPDLLGINSFGQWSCPRQIVRSEPNENHLEPTCTGVSSWGRQTTYTHHTQAYNNNQKVGGRVQFCMGNFPIWLIRCGHTVSRSRNRAQARAGVADRLKLKTAHQRYQHGMTECQFENDYLHKKWAQRRDLLAQPYQTWCFAGSEEVQNL